MSLGIFPISGMGDSFFSMDGLMHAFLAGADAWASSNGVHFKAYQIGDAGGNETGLHKDGESQRFEI